MAEQQNVDFLITARDAATRVLQNIGKGFDDITRSYQSLQTLVAGTGVFSAMQRIVEATIDAERASNQLNSTLRATGFSAGLARGELDAIAEDLKAHSPFDDDAIRKGLASLLRFRDVQGDVFREAAKLSVDLAAALDTGVTEAMTRLGRALEDPEKGLRALREAGLNVTNAQERVKKAMQETGDVAVAQKIILEELAKSVGGAAAGENQGLYGSVKAVTKAWEDFVKGLGQLEGENRRLQRTFEMIKGGLELITPASKKKGSTQEERDIAAQGAAAAESARLQEFWQKWVDDQIKTIEKEREEREKRLREEDIKGWVAHAEAVVQEDFRMAQMLAKVHEDFWREEDKRRDEQLRKERDFRRSIAERAADIQIENMTEMELLNMQLVQKQEIIDAAQEMQLMSAEEANRQRELLELQHQARLGNASAQGILERRNLEQKGATQQAEFYFGYLAQITAAGAQHNRALFRLNQMAGIANAIISTAQGAAKALEWGFPLGPIFAAIITAAGAVQIKTIAGAKFGDTSAPSIGGGTAIPVTPAEISAPAAFQGPPVLAQPAAPQTRVNVTIVGSDDKSISYRQIVDDLIPALNEALGNGAEINLSLT